MFKKNAKRDIRSRMKEKEGRLYADLLVLRNKLRQAMAERDMVLRKNSLLEYELGKTREKLSCATEEIETKMVLLRKAQSENLTLMTSNEMLMNTIGKVKEKYECAILSVNKAREEVLRMRNRWFFKRIFNL